MGPGVTEWQSLEARWKRESYDWVKAKIEAYLQTDGAFEPRTAGEILSMLDASTTDMPTGWARILRSDSASYKERYATVRNTLEVLARQKQVVLGTTVNIKGNPKATTYARPRDASAEWGIQIEGDATAVRRARAGIRDWLALDGSVLDGIDKIEFTRKSNALGVNAYGTTTDSKTADRGLKQPRRRKPRASARDNPGTGD